jgi:UDP-N-acetylmuramoyl-tripeptide--D-alanyl-D-alanine ligase
MELTLREIISACEGTLLCGDAATEITSISTDTRTIGQGALFIPLKGENFDGHKFIDTAVAGGACAVLTELDGEYTVPAVKVADTRLAMGKIAAYYIKKLNIPTVAVTGSVGKTTTKDMIASVLAQHFNVYKTQGNLNNDIGVPLTIFSLTGEHTAAVIEMGMNHFNEISYLTNIVKPDIAVITNVGVSHIENLGSREGILKAKCEIFEGLKPGGTAIVNGDNDMLITLKEKHPDFVYFGMDSAFPIYADNIKERGINGIDCTIHKGDTHFDVSIHIPGKHMVSNALAAAAVGFALNMTADEIKAGIEKFEPTKMRMDVLKTDCLTIINDAYNSNPVSAMASVDVLAGVEGKRCAILGDMFELGDFAPDLHRKLGEYTASKSIDQIICIGELSKNMYEGALSVKSDGVFYFPDCDSFLSSLDKVITAPCTALVKASRGMRFERIAEQLKQLQL